MSAPPDDFTAAYYHPLHCHLIIS